MDLSQKLTLAYEALQLVEKGHSERSALLHIVAVNPRLRNHRKEALSFVLGTVSGQNLIDRIVQAALADRPLERRELCLARLAVHLTLLAPPAGLSSREVVKALRAITPDPYRPRLEYLLGFLHTREVREFYEGLDDVEQVALRTCHPAWWVGYCFRLFGRGEAVKLLSAGPRPRYLRVNPLRNRGRAGLPSTVKSLTSGIVELESVPQVFVVSGESLSKLSSYFATGVFQLQDLASFLAVKAGDPMPDESVLDLCAAPGAKTGALAQMMRNRGRIISVDYSSGRMRAWKGEMGRLGVKIAMPVVEDASRSGLKGTFDLVLVDPPCSGTGVFDRNPRMKWHLSPKFIDRYSQLQYRLLDEASRLTSHEGRIVYCTCSITVEENERVVSKFLEAHPEFETRPILKTHGSPGLRGLEDCRRFYPHRDGTAGYFIARLERFN